MQMRYAEKLTAQSQQEEVGVRPLEIRTPLAGLARGPGGGGGERAGEVGGWR